MKIVPPRLRGSDRGTRAVQESNSLTLHFIGRSTREKTAPFHKKKMNFLFARVFLDEKVISFHLPHDFHLAPQKQT